jgi:hypothetical protein
LFLVSSVIMKLAFFAFLCFAWAAMGAEWSYQYHSVPQTQAPAAGRRTYYYEMRPSPLSYEMFLGFGLLGFAYGAVSRMLLLRWRRGYFVGVSLSILVFAAVCVGSWLQYIDRRDNVGNIPPLPGNMLTAAVFGCGWVILGAIFVWPIWHGLVTVFLPKRAATALLDWQRAQSNRVSDLAREPIRPTDA